jgi:hypothetical protein
LYVFFIYIFITFLTYNYIVNLPGIASKDIPLQAFKQLHIAKPEQVYFSSSMFCALSMMLWLPLLNKPSTFILLILALLESLSLHTIPALPNTQKLLNQVQAQTTPPGTGSRIPKPQFGTSNKSLIYPATLKTLFKSATTPCDSNYKCWNCKQPGTSPTSILSESLR